MGNHPAAKFDPSKAQSMSMLGRYCVIIECKIGSMHRALGCVLYIATYGNGQGKMLYIDCLVQYCSNSSALAMELLRCCCKPSIYNMLSHCLVPSLAIDIKRDLGIYLEWRIQLLDTSIILFQWSRREKLTSTGNRQQQTQQDTECAYIFLGISVFVVKFVA